MRRIVSAALLILAGCGGSGGGDSGSPNPPPPQTAFTDPVVYSSAPQASLATAAEITSVTRHAITLNGAAINYTATAGHLTSLELGSNAPQASFFYVAYTADGQPPATRPVTFFYNGGPGSATVWLHLGSYGPKRLATRAPATDSTAAFPLVDNAESLLDTSDLVFVNAVGTGYSQAIAPNTNQTFWGVDADGAVFRDFVRRYVAVNNRAASPKFLFGESYGGPRTAVLARLLEASGMPLAGVVLQAPAMNYNSNCGLVQGASCGGFIPSYGASAAWFERTVPAVPPAGVPAFMAALRTFTATEYEPALRSLPLDGPMLASLASQTGIGAAQWQAVPNLPPGLFREALIPGTLLGRYDTRMAAARGTALASGGDPSSTYISARFAQAIVTYLAGTLGYTNPSSYVTLGNAIETWNFSHDGLGLPDTIPDLAAAMVLNPRLKVLAISGYHDLATPFYKTELDLARLPAAATVNVAVRNYEGGHMTYLDDESRVLGKADLVAFYRAALAPGSLKGLEPAAGTTPRSTPFAIPAGLPAALAEVPMRDPWIPPQLAKSASAAPETTGAALDAQVQRKLRADHAASPMGQLGTVPYERWVHHAESRNSTTMK